MAYQFPERHFGGKSTLEKKVWNVIWQVVPRCYSQRIVNYFAITHSRLAGFFVSYGTATREARKLEIRLPTFKFQTYSVSFELYFII
jgi:hypothetical protein